MPIYNHVLAIETSCDDTSIAIVDHRGWVKAISTANQDFDHQSFGGVVPEIASRKHSIAIVHLIEKTLNKADMHWDDIDGIAVTNRPGLNGSLIVGVITAKALALAHNKPLIGVNHMEAHLLAPFLKDDQYSPPADFGYPYVALAISGGHTHLYFVRSMGEYEVMGQTRDDAAGEAFDKFAKMVGLGFPGGVKVDKAAQDGNPKKFNFPRPMINEDSFNFSFSGLKAAALRKVLTFSEEHLSSNLADLCASYQQAIVDVLLNKLDRAMRHTQLTGAVLTGGVSANSCLRKCAQEWAQLNGYQCVVPPIRYCTDNAAMVGFVGIERLNRGEKHDQSLRPSPSIWVSDFKEFSL